MVYLSFNGANFDHIILNRIFNAVERKKGDQTELRSFIWKGSTFIDVLKWVAPCNLKGFSKTWLNEDLKDIVKDVEILRKGSIKLEEMYNSIGYSITDSAYQGIASISYDLGLRYIKEDDFEVLSKEEYDEWKTCLLGGICEHLDRNLEQKRVYVNDVNGLYTHVRLIYDYPVGPSEEIVNPSVEEFNKGRYFGLIKALVINDGKVPLGVPFRDGKDSKRVSGRIGIRYEGTTEELRNLCAMGATVRRIEKIRHYSRRKSGKELFGKAIELFENIKQEGEREGKLSLVGRKFNPDGTSEPFEINSLSQSLENSIKVSLENTELDVQEIRVKTAHNSKIPVKKGWI